MASCLVYGAMQIDAPNTIHSIKQMVARLTSQRLWHEDLVQEALIHLWQEEHRCPNQSPSWYLRSCQFHLWNRMRHGRSIDSPRRRNGHVVSLDAPAEAPDAFPDVTADGSVFELVLMRDLLSALLEGLTPIERKVLACLLDGLGTREASRRLKLSHTCVAGKRRQIAARLLKLLEEEPPATHVGNSPGARDEAAVANRPPELLLPLARARMRRGVPKKRRI